MVVAAKATWDDATGSAPVIQIGLRSGMSAFRPWFGKEASGEKVSDLKDEYQRLRGQFPALPAPGPKQKMMESLREFEAENPSECELIESSDQFYGWTRGSNKLSKYVQWVYIPAVKEASTEQDESRNSALGVLLERTVRERVNFDARIDELKRSLGEEYAKMLEAQQQALSSLSGSIAARLGEWLTAPATVDIRWQYDKDKSISVNQPIARALVGDDGFVGEVTRLGHGLQRAFIVAMLQELAMGGEEDDAKIILGFEEPELFQHPPQAKHLFSVLEKLAQQNHQIALTTHSPYFVSINEFHGIRRVAKKSQKSPSEVFRASAAGVLDEIKRGFPDGFIKETALMAKIGMIMQPSQNEMFFAKVPIFIEGMEDAPYFATYLQLLGAWDEFLKLGCHFVKTDGKPNMTRPLAIANSLSIPAMSVFDSDVRGKGGDDEKNQIEQNTGLFILSNERAPKNFESDFLGEKVLMFAPTLKDSIRAEVGADAWDSAFDAVVKSKDLQGVGLKNPLVISAILEELWGQGTRSSKLMKACHMILSYAKS